MEHAVKESKKTQKRADPLEVLPSEVVIQIFNELTFKQCCRLLRVSKGWNSILVSVPELWKRVDLTPSRAKAIEIESLRYYIHNSRWDVNGVIIGHLTQLDVDAAMELVCECPNVQELDIRPSSYHLGDRGAGSLWKLAPTLTALKLSNGCFTDTLYALKILQDFKRLERIELNLKLGDVRGHPLPDVMPRLRSFGFLLKKGWGIAASIREFLQEVPRLMPELRELRFYGRNFLNRRFLDPASLNHLRVMNMQGYGLPEFRMLPPSLEYLKLQGETDGYYEEVSDNFTSMSHIRGVYITVDGTFKCVRQFLQFPESLEFLRMPLCSFLPTGMEPTYTSKLRSLKIVDFSASLHMILSRITNWLSQTGARLTHLSLARVIFDSVDSDDWHRFITAVDWEELIELDLTSQPHLHKDNRNRTRNRTSGQGTPSRRHSGESLRSTESISEVVDLPDLINTYMPNLEVLNLTGCPVGISTIKAIVKGNRGKLKKLIAVDCVLDEDFPELLRCGWGTGVKIYSVRRYGGVDPEDKSEHSSGGDDDYDEGSEQWGYVTPMRNVSDDAYTPFISLERDIDGVFFN